VRRRGTVTNQALPRKSRYTAKIAESEQQLEDDRRYALGAPYGGRLQFTDAAVLTLLR
jgi:hypothetical protein